MPVSEDFQLLVIDQLSSIASIRTRRMFGGLGIYSGDLFFALADDDVLYFKVDEETKSDFEAAGSRPFVPFEGATTMGYWNVPAEVLEDTDALGVWMRKAIAVAARAKKPAKKPQTRRSSKPKSFSSSR
ncbi:MAG: TfoX/Sxy family protein [Thermoanaerobaculia bacterium]